MVKPIDDSLFHLAFKNSAQANIIALVSTGRILVANRAACKLLGYSEKELLTKSSAGIFDSKEQNFIKMVKERAAQGHSIASVKAFRKKGASIHCQVASSIFTGQDKIKKSITSITDLSASIFRQKVIDASKEKTVADNIILAKSVQAKIDVSNNKVVAENIEIAKSVQSKIDVRNNKVVAENIQIAKSVQSKIDVKNNKIVAENIQIAKSVQVKIDIKNNKIVAENIQIAKSVQTKIDVENKRIVAENIVIAKSKEKKTAADQHKLVTDNIAAAVLKQKGIDIVNKKVETANINAAHAEADAIIIANNKWIKHIAKASYDVMWDWDILSDKVYVGDSIREIFGYVLKNNSINFSELRDSLPKHLFKNVFSRLEEVLASQSKSWADSFRIKKADGTEASVNSRATIVRNEEGKAIRMIGAMQDVSRLQELEIKVTEQIFLKEENNDMFQIAAKLSYDGIWDWNILTGDFFLGEGFEQLFGFEFNKEHNAVIDWTDFLHPEDKEAVQKGLAKAIESSDSTWEHAYRFVRTDKKIVNVFGRASIIRDADGKANRMIGVIHDLSRQKNLEEKLELQNASAEKLLVEQNENFRLMFNSSSDVLYDINLATDEIMLSDGYEKKFGHKKRPNMKPAEVWGKHLHPDDKEAVLQDYYRMLATKETVWIYSYRFMRKNGSFANVLSRRIILRDADGKAYRMIGSMQDISKQKGLEEKLKHEINLKEIEIEDAKESERSEIGRELHDNVNQMLSVSRLYLEMAKQGGSERESLLSRSSEYTLNAIEEIRKLTKGLTTPTIKNLGLCDSIENLARVTMEVQPIQITCSFEGFDEKKTNDKFKVNVLRIVQEQLNNVLKHAQAKKVSIHLSQNSKFITLIMKDDGIGFDISKKRKGIGIDNIKSRAAVYNGKLEFNTQPQEGCILTILFAISSTMLKAIV